MPTAARALKDPLWVPLLSHYNADGLDLKRMRAHAISLRSAAMHLMLGGSTGDGWELDDRAFEGLLKLGLEDQTFEGDRRIIFGALRHETEDVIRRIHTIEQAVDAAPPDARRRVLGVTVCPPVNPSADQAKIVAHYNAVLRSTQLPIVLYQLPQVTGCRLEPHTVRQLAEKPRIVLFKDSSGEDTVTRDGATGHVPALRGAENGYADALRANGGTYDGWFLSSGNIFAAEMQELYRLCATGQRQAMRTLSDRVEKAVAALFAAVRSLPFGNAFSNANRAGDHILAYGSSWRDAPLPLTHAGVSLPPGALEAAEAAIRLVREVPHAGYLIEENLTQIPARLVSAQSLANQG
jgi:dihydrodipicolinate synthase/N-acetylneuraminate lyase